MTTPTVAQYTEEQIENMREQIVEKMRPLTVEVLRRLRDAGDIQFEEERLLDRYEALTWLIGE